MKSSRSSPCCAPALHETGVSTTRVAATVAQEKTLRMIIGHMSEHSLHLHRRLNACQPSDALRPSQLAGLRHARLALSDGQPLATHAELEHTLLAGQAALEHSRPSQRDDRRTSGARPRDWDLAHALVKCQVGGSGSRPGAISGDLQLAAAPRHRGGRRPPRRRVDVGLVVQLPVRIQVHPGIHVQVAETASACGGANRGQGAAGFAEVRSRK